MVSLRVWVIAIFTGLLMCARVQRFVRHRYSQPHELKNTNSISTNLASLWSQLTFRRAFARPANEG